MEEWDVVSGEAGKQRKEKEDLLPKKKYLQHNGFVGKKSLENRKKKKKKIVV